MWQTRCVQLPCTVFESGVACWRSQKKVEPRCDELNVTLCVPVSCCERFYIRVRCTLDQDSVPFIRWIKWFCFAVQDFPCLSHCRFHPGLPTLRWYSVLGKKFLLKLTCIRGSFSALLRMCPSSVSLRLSTTWDIFRMCPFSALSFDFCVIEFAFRITFSFVQLRSINVGGIFRILRILFCWNASSLWARFSVSSVVSKPYISFDVMTALYTFSFHFIDPLTFVQNRFNDLMVGMQLAIRLLISTSLLHVLVSFPLKYMTLSAWLSSTQSVKRMFAVGFLPFFNRPNTMV